MLTPCFAALYGYIHENDILQFAMKIKRSFFWFFFSRWIILSAIAILSVQAAPRELNSEELITEPRPGEEYVNIQTGGQPPHVKQPQKVDLNGKC